tara:strand:+ start:2751 stop:3206 length:456 start_codon:yes stop_codon:yes gene_type:complete
MIKFLLGQSGTGLTSYALFLAMKKTKHEKVLFLAGNDKSNAIRRKLYEINKREDLAVNHDNFGVISKDVCSSCNWELKKILEGIIWDYTYLVIDPLFYFYPTIKSRFTWYLKTLGVDDILIVSSEHMFQKLGFKSEYEILQIPPKYRASAC